MKTVLLLGEADLKVRKKRGHIGLSFFSDAVLRAEPDVDMVIYFDGRSAEVLKNRDGPCVKVRVNKEMIQLLAP